MSEVSLTAPLAILFVAIAADAAAVVIRRTRPSTAWWSRWLPFGLRPIAALAGLNLCFRIVPATFKFHPLTFPLYANPWDGAADSGFPLRLALALAASATMLGALAAALRRPSLAMAVAVWLACVSVQLAIPLVPRGWDGVLRPWTAPGKVYAWAARRVERSGGVVAFLDDYDRVQKIQPVHARSHPPGATLASYWTQRLHDTPAQRTNPIRLIVISSLALPLVYAMGIALADRRQAIAAAALFGSMPAATVYPTYSHDPLFAVFLLFHLWLSLGIAQGRDRIASLLLAGVALFAASMMTFAAAFGAAAAFLLALLFREPGPIASRELMRRLALPPIIAAGLHLALALATGFDFSAAYLEAYRFHDAYYPFAGIGDALYALVGGQLELLWGVGPVAGGVAVMALVRRHLSLPVRSFAFALVAPFAVAILFGPNPLKLETARCWYWLAAVPALVAADRVLGQDGEKSILFLAGSSLAVAIVSVSLLNFGA